MLDPVVQQTVLVAPLNLLEVKTFDKKTFCLKRATMDESAPVFWKTKLSAQPLM